LRAEYGASVIAWQNAASPVLFQDWVLVNGNSPGECLMAFRKLDGGLVWKAHDRRMTQSSPVIARIGGVAQVVFFTQAGLLAVEPATGRVLWELPLNYNGTSVAASPVVMGDLVYASRAYPASLSSAKAGAVVARVVGDGEGWVASTHWYRTNQLMNHWSTPVEVKGHLYGLFGQGTIGFRCVEASTGEQTWPESGVGAPVGGFGYGSVIVVGDCLLALTERGTLVLVLPDPGAYTELGRYPALTASGTKCWNSPAVSDGRIYLRSTREAVCLDVSIAPLALSARLSGDRLGLSMRLAGGGAIGADRMARVEVLWADTLQSGGTEWMPLTNPAALVDGAITVEDGVSAGERQRFYRARELR